MAVVVEPVLTEEKLRLLLAEGHEQSSLDYKRKLNLDDKRDVVELAKDVAAMQSEPLGGYVVVGADDNGHVVAEMTEQLASLFDETKVRAKLKKYLAEPFEIRVARHVINNSIVILIYAGPAEHGWCVFAVNGEYSAPGQRAPTVVFRIGEVFVRHGTASERWTSADLGRLVKQTIAKRKEEWRAEYREELAALAATGITATKLVALPASAISWRLDAHGFDELVTELIRRNDDIPLRQMLVKLPSDAAELLGSNPDELETLLDRLTSFGALALQFERREWLQRVIKAFVSVYEAGFDKTGQERTEPEVVQLWLDIASRVSALGGLAVRLEDWESVHNLADRRPNGNSFGHFGGWIRHAVTYAARARVFERDKRGLIARAHNVVRAVDATHFDVEADSERVLDSLCRFDALGCLVVIGERGSLKSGNFYPSFSHYYSRRTEPIFRALIENREMRARIFPGTDRFLADALNELNSIANSESFQYNGWDGLEDDQVRAFVTSNKTPDSR